jgi:hypothetical protein
MKIFVWFIVINCIASVILKAYHLKTGIKPKVTETGLLVDIIFNEMLLIWGLMVV